MMLVGDARPIRPGQFVQIIDRVPQPVGMDVTVVEPVRNPVDPAPVPPLREMIEEIREGDFALVAND